MKHFAMLLILLLAVVVGNTQAQLTTDDIEALRQQGVEEGWTFEVTQNPATEYALDELCGLSLPDNWQDMAPWVSFDEKRDLPAAFDWRTVEGCPPVRNQGGCGSCWAFATAGALECNILIRDGEVVDLSEQWLVSCNSHGWGCDGGWWAHDYFDWRTDPCDSSGAVMEAEFAYTASDAICHCPYNHPYHIESWAYIGSSNATPSVSAMKQAIMEYGPISVGVSANSAMQSYGGGIFNGCSGTELNHGVVLVGWDDNQGDYGIWIMRNSWGAGWGEDGYMRMPYGCSMIGYGACYTNYIGGATLYADTTIGWVPLDVNFEGVSSLEVDEWTWDFGDGDSAYVQNPFHCYEEPGLYSVTLQVDAAGDVRQRTKPDFILALADTMKVDSAVAVPYESMEFVVYGRNSTSLEEIRLPVEYGGTMDLVYDSFSTVGCRTDYFEEQGMVHFSSSSKRMTFKLRTSNLETAPDLAAGYGPILKLYFHVNGTPLFGTGVVLNLDGYLSGLDERLPIFSGYKAEYVTATVDGAVTYESCCQGIRGNIDDDPDDIIDIADMVWLVEYMFAGGEAPPCLKEANVDGDFLQEIDIADMVHLVDYMFNGGPEPAICY